jgi:hypothetical protein
MLGRRLSAFALLLSCVSAPGQASVAPGPSRDCWDAQELEALKLQRFKTMLLVGMLNCRDQEPGIAADYNRFVRANRNLIAEKQAVVREHFIRTSGPSAGLNDYSDFETAIGNRYSDADFDYRRCAAIADDARMAGYVSEAGLMDMIASMPDEDRLAVCRAEPRYASRWAPAVQPPVYAEPVRAAEVAPPPPAPMPERAQEAPVVAEAPAVEQAPVQTAQAEPQEWPDLAPVDAEGPAQAVDPNVVKAEAKPVQVASVEVSKPADRVSAVREAAKALREALAALEADEVSAR